MESKYCVIHYCSVLPCFEVVDKGLSLKEAEELAKHKKKMWLINHPNVKCCEWYVQKQF